MKKKAILLFVIFLVGIGYNEATKTKQTSSQEKKLYDHKSIEYRIAEKQNLIVEEDKWLEKNNETVQEEADFTAYIENISQDVESITKKEELSVVDKKTLTNTFITLTDFIFYEGKINGKTFNELTNETKQKILTLYEKIDAKIENVYPGYKEKIKETSLKTYTNIKDMLTKAKEDIAASYKKEIGEEKYDAQIEEFNESKETMKKSFEPVIEVIKEESKEIYATSKEKLDKWYQTWKEENS